MKTWIIKTGGMKWRVKAKTPQMATMIALHLNEEPIGLLVSAKEKGKSKNSQVYYNSSTLLENIGFKVNKIREDDSK